MDLRPLLTARVRMHRRAASRVLWMALAAVAYPSPPCLAQPPPPKPVATVPPLSARRSTPTTAPTPTPTSSVIAVPRPATAPVPIPVGPSLPMVDGTRQGNVELRPPDDPPAPPSPVAPGPPVAEPKRYLVHDESGQPIVARFFGEGGGRMLVILPDGQLGTPSRLIETTEPFRPEPIEAMERELQVTPFRGFMSRRSAHYLLFYQGSSKFAEASNDLLEKLYVNLTQALRIRDVELHEAEFPMVAVIYATEREFRARRKVPVDVQAYYELYTNRIYFYEKSDHDELAPQAAALRRPQTVAHEGTHQILANIGVQPRLSPWPPWLTEGLAEYCSPPMKTRKGNVTWAGLGQVNPLHMTTIHDLYDRNALRALGNNAVDAGTTPPNRVAEHLMALAELTPTDYALAWGLTHYLAEVRTKEFIAYLKTMSRLAPLSTLTDEQHCRMFRAAFGQNDAKLDAAVRNHLKRQKFDPVPYFAVLFEQDMPNGIIRRGAFVSQSPPMISQWVSNMTSPRGAEPRRETHSYLTRTRALQDAEAWLHSR